MPVPEWIGVQNQYPGMLIPPTRELGDWMKWVEAELAKIEADRAERLRRFTEYMKAFHEETGD